MTIKMKVPPHSMEAEKSVLGALLLARDAMIEVAEFLRPEMFYADAHQRIYEAMVSLYENRDPIDVVTVSDWLRKKNLLKKVGGTSYLTELLEDVPTAAHVAGYARIVKDYFIKREMIGTASNLVEIAFDEGSETGMILDKAEQAIFRLSQRNLRGGFIHVKDALSESFDRLDELHKAAGGLRGVPTGFKDLDNALAGMQDSNLLILAARPGMGKTSLALNIAQYVAVGTKVPVGFFSLEMSNLELVDRLLVSQANIDAWKMKTGNLNEEEDFGKLSEAMGVLADSPLYIDDTPGLSILEMRTKARRLQAEYGARMIVVDYLQLVTAPGRYEGRVQEVQAISQGLKNLARELKLPVLALSQLSRAIEQRGTKIPQLSDLRESGCLLGDSLIVRADTGERMRIENLVGETNVLVLALDKDLRLVKAKASRVFSSGRKRVYELKLRSGRRIKASANHPFLKLEGWKRLDQLRVGDRLAVPRRISLTLKKDLSLSKNRLILLAHLDEELAIYGQRSREKVIPEVVFGQSDTNIALFLRHLWATDGCIFNRSAKSRGPRVRLYYASSSRQLADQVSHLLLRLGILSVIRSSAKEGYKPTWTVQVTGKRDQLRFLEVIGCVGRKVRQVDQAKKELNGVEANPNNDVVPKEVWQMVEERRNELGWSTREFHQKMSWAYSGTQRQGNGISRGRLAKIATVLADENLRCLAESDIYWDEVAEIRELGVREVYDMTVPGHHNFVADDVLVHNSIEQDADVVMFLYRENDENLRNYKLNIAKHRNGPLQTIEMIFEAKKVKFFGADKKREG